MKTRNIIMIVVAAIVAVLAIVLVVVGVSTHTEPGFMQVCWQPNRTVLYRSHCEHPEEIVWEQSQIPLEIYEPTGTRALDEAISRVNFQVGCEIVRRSSSPLAPVQVFVDHEFDVGRDLPGGNTMHFRESDGTLRASIETMMVTHSEAQVRVLFHEIGHVLNLDHDFFESSAMYPIIPDTDHLEFFRFTDNDVRLLNERYCHGSN